MVMKQYALSELKNKISGEIITPADSAYDSLRGVFVRTGSPTLIARPHSTADVAAAIQFARDNQLTLSVRSGGHAMTGLSTNDGGLILDLAHFNSVELLDASRNLVRIGAGARWGDAAKALAEWGFAISSGDTTSVGVGGLTLGGGIGWMVRKYGLTIDSLEAADIVLADGRCLRVSTTDSPELFWALRGGGGNFGVVTALEFRAQAVGDVFAGAVIYSIADYKSVLTGWVAAMESAPEELNSTLIVFPGLGPEPQPMLMVLLCYAGDDEATANAAVQPLLELATPVHQDIQRKPYYAVLEEAAPPPGIKSVTQNGFVKAFTPNVIETLLAHYGKVGTPILQIRKLEGAVNQIASGETAFAHRGYSAFILAASLVPVAMPAEQIEQIRQAGWQPLKSLVSGAYVNFLSDVSEESLSAAYPEKTRARLAAVKATYDPQNVFNQNLNIKPRR